MQHTEKHQRIMDITILLLNHTIMRQELVE